MYVLNCLLYEVAARCLYCRCGLCAKQNYLSKVNWNSPWWEWHFQEIQLSTSVSAMSYMYVNDFGFDINDIININIFSMMNDK